MRVDVFVMQGEFLSMRDLTVSAGLTDQQRLLVHLLINRGKGTEEAGELAGYAKGSVYSALKRPAVAAAIAEAIQLDLATVGAPLAYRVAKNILKDDAVSARVRADLSMKILDRAGHIVPSRKDSGPQKALSEMNQAELLAFIETNQAAIDRAELELAGQARDITPHHPAPIDAKALNFLD
jgi:hypothetical protein